MWIIDIYVHIHKPHNPSRRMLPCVVPTALNQEYAQQNTWWKPRIQHAWNEHAFSIKTPSCPCWGHSWGGCASPRRRQSANAAPPLLLLLTQLCRHVRERLEPAVTSRGDGRRGRGARTRGAHPCLQASSASAAPSPAPEVLCMCAYAGAQYCDSDGVVDY